MRITPRISNSQSDRFHMDSASVNPEFRIGMKLPDRSKTVESKQSSVEVALVTCCDFEDIDQSKKKNNKSHLSIFHANKFEY